MSNKPAWPLWLAVSIVSVGCFCLGVDTGKRAERAKVKEQQTRAEKIYTEAFLELQGRK